MDAKPNPRLPGIDALRGSVMILMALDHVRDFLHRDAMSTSPTDLTRTTPLLFLTRWVTHFCLPVFMFAAGTGAFLWWRHRSHSKRQLSRFLLTRGIWFVALELSVMQFVYNFRFSSRLPILLLILWIFGICMVVMAALIHLSERWLLALSIAVIALHNGLDGVSAGQFGSGAWVWNLIHQPGFVTLRGRSILVTYTLLPWIGVMTAGFCFGRVMLLEETARRRLTLRIGLALTAAFFVVRALNRYGDPAPWSSQRSTVFTVLSFLNCTKYPGSLDFLLMTVGPALLLLRYLDGRTLRTANPLLVFGRTSLFYFIVHFYAIHSAAVFLAWLRYGKAALRFMFNPLPSMGEPRQLFPVEFGYSLPVVYLFWIALVAALYLPCRWFANLKATRRGFWMSYL